MCKRTSPLAIIGLIVSFVCYTLAAAGVGARPAGAAGTRQSPRQRLVLSGHKGRVEALAFSPDGSTLATGADEPTARLWDVATGQPKAKLPGHWLFGTVESLSFSPDGRMLATRGYKTVRLWDARTGEPKWKIKGGKGRIIGYSFSPDGRTIAVTSNESFSVPLWDVETGRLRASLALPKMKGWGAGSVAFSPDGHTLANVSASSLAYIWDVPAGKISHVLEGHGETIDALAFSFDGSLLATGGKDYSVQLWDVTTGKRMARLQHAGHVFNLEFSRDGRYLATGCDDRKVRLWDVKSAELIAELPHRGSIWSLSFSPDGSLLATGSDNEKVVKIWDTATGSLRAELTGGQYPVAFSPDGLTLATAGGKNTALLWDVPVK
jgi:WD40 repeat protein